MTRLANGIVVAAFVFLSSFCKYSTSFFENEYCEFIYSRAEVGYGDSYSMKFTKADTVYFQRHKYNPANEITYCLLNDDDRKYLSDELCKIRWNMFDSTYIQKGIEDGTNRKFYAKNNKIEKWAFMYGEGGPKELIAIANWADKLRSSHVFRTTRKVDFGNLHHIITPAIVLPSK